MGAKGMTAGEPPELHLPIRRMLALERAEKIVMAMFRGKLPGLTDAELEQIIAIAGEDAPLFDPDTLELDGWRRVHNRRWIPPEIHAIDPAPVRGKDERPDEQPGSSPAHGSDSGTPGSSTAAQKLAELTPTEFRDECEAIRNDELRERWANDRENWIHRWDRRADWIGRWGKRQLP